MKQNLKVFSGLFAGLFFALLIASQFSFRKTDAEQTGNKMDNERVMYKWHAPEVPDQMSFAGEKVPLERWDVYERLDREILFNYYNMDNMLFILKLANRYFPAIEAKLKANGIPDDFKYLCVAESNLMNATSRAGAVGFWQFMPGSAPGYGLEINSTVDERYDYMKAADAACKYLKQAYAKFGSWTAAAASYNCGQGGYNSQATFQQTKYYYDLLLPEETNRYIFRILAFKHLMGNAEELGYILPDSKAYHPVQTRSITVSESIPNLAQFAINNGTTYKMLKLLNPWMRSKSLSVRKGNSYVVLLPK